LLFWSAREESLIIAVKSQRGAVEELRRKGAELSVVCTGIRERRFNISWIVKKEVESEENAARKVCVVTCGPGGMADEVRAMVVDCTGKNGVQIELVDESFDGERINLVYFPLDRAIRYLVRTAISFCGKALDINVDVL
jgi:hypothetical protein